MPCKINMLFERFLNKVILKKGEKCVFVYPGLRYENKKLITNQKSFV